MADIVPIVDEGLGNSSYLVDVGDGRAVVVDPERDPIPYLAAAERRGLTITHTVETHLHADFVSGSRELAARGAVVVAAADAGLAFPHRALTDGDRVDLGGLTLQALATPGHTPEHLSYLLIDGTRPLALFSGGSLLVAAVARTDLVAPEQTEHLARALWRSLRQRVLALPDDLPVYPTHGAGSFCSSPAGADRVTTIGRERATNPLLGAPDEDTFVKTLLGGLGSYPPYFLRMRDINRSGPGVHGRSRPLAGLTPHQVRRAVDEGAQLVDARPVAAFAAGHIPGAVSNPLRAQFSTWLGWLTEPDRPVIFVLDADQDRRQVVWQALNVGQENLAGELAGGVRAWGSAGLPLRRVRLVDAGAVTGTILDVRQASEFAAGHVPGARNVELGALATAPVAPCPAVVMCGHGERAMTAASLLAARHGVEGVDVAVGGPLDWSAATGRPLEVP